MNHIHVREQDPLGRVRSVWLRQDGAIRRKVLGPTGRILVDERFTVSSFNVEQSMDMFRGIWTNSATGHSSVMFEWSDGDQTQKTGVEATAAHRLLSFMMGFTGTEATSLRQNEGYPIADVVLVSVVAFIANYIATVSWGLLHEKIVEVAIAQGMVHSGNAFSLVILSLVSMVAVVFMVYVGCGFFGAKMDAADPSQVPRHAAILSAFVAMIIAIFTSTPIVGSIFLVFIASFAASLGTGFREDRVLARR